jgi:hypothetical protein
MGTARINEAADAGEVRARLHGMWGSVAEGWASHAAFVDERVAGVTAALLRATLPQPGERALELAAGPGGVGLAVSPLVGADGTVVVSLRQ